MINRLTASVFSVLLAAPAFAGPVLSPNGSVPGINGGFGNVIGSSATLDVNVSAAGLVSMTLNQGGGGLFNAGVIYIDSVAGGFASTSGLNDTGDPGRRAISGTNGAGSADLAFAPGFEADYAITLETAFSGLFSLDATSHGFVASVSTDGSRNATDASFGVAFNLSDIGLALGDSFRFVVTYLNQEDAGGPFRSDEFIGVAASTVTGGNIGQNPVSLVEGDFVTVDTTSLTVQPIPSPAAFGAGMMLFGLGLLRRR